MEDSSFWSDKAYNSRFTTMAAMEMAADLPLIMPPIYNVDDWYHSTITPRTYVEKTLEERKNAKNS